MRTMPPSIVASRAEALGKNGFEWAARARKVQKMLDVLSRRTPTVTALDAERFGDAEWSTLAREADVKAPSEKTRRYVVAQLRLHCEEPNSIDVSSGRWA